MISKVQIIIRTAGERTEDLCQRLILDQGVPRESVVIVREAPFSKAMRKSLEIGIAGGRPWTFCIDADVLLRPGSIQRMLEFAERQSEDVCEIQGFVLCKFFGGPRTAGNHLYRTPLLERVIANIPSEGVNTRPEFHALESMKEQGYPWITVPYVVGLHDFEQHYRDTFRKCFIQAHKHEYLAELFLKIWRDGASKDADYRVALAGFARGIEHHGPVYIDARDTMFHVNLENAGLREKSPIDVDGWPLARVDEVIRNWREPEIYLMKFPDRLGLDVPQANHPSGSDEDSWKRKLREKHEEVGFFRFVPYLVGLTLANLGRRLQLWSSK